MWSEGMIARALSRQFFKRNVVALLPNCTFTGHETDLLVITRDLHIIDCEIKISRADLKADAKKDKWWHRMSWLEAHDAGLALRGKKWDPWEYATPNEWPPKVWKHFYCLPADLWVPSLADCLPSTQSGVLGIRKTGPTRFAFTSIRPARANKEAHALKPGDAINIARLANLRMWDAYAQLEAWKPRKQRVRAL